MTEAAEAASLADPLVARILALGVGVGVFGALCVYAWVMRARHLRRAAAESKPSDAEAPLRPGPATLEGIVLAEGHGPPVVVRIHQRGTEYQVKLRREHNWIEDRREVQVRSFRLKRPSGETVRIEPHERLLLAHPLSLPHLGHGHVSRRVRVSSLDPGTQVRVTGTLVRNTNPPRGSRADAASELLMRPPPGSRMVIASESLADYHLARARRHRKVGLLTLAVLLLSHGLVFLKFDVLAIAGHVVQTPVAHVDAHVQVLPPKTPSSQRSYRVIRNRTVENVPYLVAGPFRQVGQAASIGTLTSVLYPFFALMFLFFGTLPTAIGRRWWDFPRLVEHGSGGLRADSVTYH